MRSLVSYCILPTIVPCRATRSDHSGSLSPENPVLAPPSRHPRPRPTACGPQRWCAGWGTHRGRRVVASERRAVGTWRRAHAGYPTTRRSRSHPAGRDADTGAGPPCACGAPAHGPLAGADAPSLAFRSRCGVGREPHGRTRRRGGQGVRRGQGATSVLAGDTRTRRRRRRKLRIRRPTSGIAKVQEQRESTGRRESEASHSPCSVRALGGRARHVAPTEPWVGGGCRWRVRLCVRQQQ